MARFELYQDGSHFLLDLQADAVDTLNTRVVVPIRLPEHAPEPARRLNPSFQIGGKRHVMVTQFIAAVPEFELGKRVGNLSAHRDEITAALDMLFHGF
jgi:toxin CcdB